jgi:RimJ/RimL family protein N-acetyltransferase
MTSPCAASTYEAVDATRDGERFVVRAIRPSDKETLLETFRRLSPRSVYLGFFEFKSELSAEDLAYFTELDFEQHVGLVATLEEGGLEKIVGVARYFVENDTDPRAAEAAFAVVDQHQGRGIGTLLLLHLARVGRACGVATFDAEVLAENLKMMKVFLHSGFEVHRTLASGMIHVSFSIAEVGGGQAGVNRQDR